MSWKIFRGVEAEGKFTGRSALFIEGDAPYHTILENIVNENCSIIYFGAHFKQFKLPSKINFTIVNKLVKAGYSVTVDGTIVDFDLLHFISTDIFKDAQSCQVIISAPSVESALFLINYYGPKHNIIIKLLDMNTKNCGLFNLQNLQIPDKALYEKDELISEGE